MNTVVLIGVLGGIISLLVVTEQRGGRKVTSQLGYFVSIMCFLIVFVAIAIEQVGFWWGAGK